MHSTVKSRLLVTAVVDGQDGDPFFSNSNYLLT